jgi:uncharacterized RDD family membrane protein YckC
MAQANAVPVSGSKLDNRRVLAALIDLAVVGVGWAVILAAAGLLGESPSGIGAPLVGVMLAWALYYYFACESGSGQTLGKRVTNIRVVGLDGAPAGTREIALRTVLRLIDMQLLYLVGLIVMLSTRERRGRLGDLVAGTMVVSADAPAPASTAPLPEPAVARVPIAESGPAFEPPPEPEPEVEPAAEQEESAGDLTSPALQELISDVAASAGSAPDEEEAVEDEPLAEPVAEEPVAQERPEDEPVDEPVGEPVEEPVEEPLEEGPAVEVLDDQPFGDEPAADAHEDEAASEPDEDVTVKSVETVSAIDLVMDDSRSKS